MRTDNRLNNQLRPVKITPGILDNPAGSVMKAGNQAQMISDLVFQT